MTLYSAKSIALLVAMGCLVLLLKAFARPRSSRSSVKPVARRFLTPREAAMLNVLERCLPHCRFHAQVSMGALLDAPPHPARRRRPSDRNAFASKIVDFVAQDRATGAIIALVEVDDRSHDFERDAVRDAMTAHAGYRTIRIARTVQPRLHEVRAAIAPLLPAQATFSRDRAND